MRVGVNEFLESTEYIDWNSPIILTKAQEMLVGTSSTEEIIRHSFEFVRDEIKHSWDYKLNPVTCKASDVLKYGTGYCYAKSHLLAALLRANKIPAGLCYQRLTIKDDQPPFCLHGLNAVYLQPYGWCRVDARGNKEGVDASFSPPLEQLAFPLGDHRVKGEVDLPEIWAAPLACVSNVLEQYTSYIDVAENLPDVAL